MAKPGRKPKPEATLKLHGTFREDRHGGSVTVPSGVPHKPAWLGDVAAAVWDERINELSKIDGLLSPVDGPALATYCQAWELFHLARERVKSEGIVAVSDKGNEFQNPAVGTLNKAIDTISRLGARFGMTPSDRMELKLPQKSATKVMRRQRA